MPMSADVPEEHIALRSYVPVKITYLDPQAQMQVASLR
jgi:hypothetical protein